MEKESFNIFIDDMVSNAFIELNSNSEERITEISLSIIEQYGNEVAKTLEEENCKVAFCLSRESTEQFRIKYSEFFTMKDGINSSVLLNDGIEVEDLIKEFRGYLPLKLLLAYIDQDVVKTGLLEPTGLLKQEKGYQKKIGTKNNQKN